MSGEKITDLPIKTTVGQDGCDLWVFFIIKHLCGENGGLVDEDAQRNIPDLRDVLGQTNDGGHVAFRLRDSAERWRNVNYKLSRLYYTKKTSAFRIYSV